MIKKILLIVAVVTLFASVAVMLLAKDSNEGKIGNINNYSKNYIYNRQEKLKKEKEEKEKVVAKLKGVACWGGSNTVGYVYANYIDFLYAFQHSGQLIIAQNNHYTIFLSSFGFEQAGTCPRIFGRQEKDRAGT